MQDVHWFGGLIGGGVPRLYHGQCDERSISGCGPWLPAYPEIPAEIRTGSFDTLRGWLTENIYCHGKKFTADELITRATGRPLAIDAYITYLRKKYGELYEL